MLCLAKSFILTQNAHLKADIQEHKTFDYSVVIGKKVQERGQQTICHHYYLRLFFQRSQMLGGRVSEKSCFHRLLASLFFLYDCIFKYSSSSPFPAQTIKILCIYMFIPCLVLDSIIAFSKVQKLFLLYNPIKSKTHSSKASYSVFEKKKQLPNVNCFSAMAWFADHIVAMKFAKPHLTNC